MAMCVFLLRMIQVFVSSLWNERVWLGSYFRTARLLEVSKAVSVGWGSACALSITGNSDAHWSHSKHPWQKIAKLWMFHLLKCSWGTFKIFDPFRKLCIDREVSAKWWYIQQSSALLPSNHTGTLWDVLCFSEPLIQYLVQSECDSDRNAFPKDVVWWAIFHCSNVYRWTQLKHGLVTSLS